MVNKNKTIINNKNIIQICTPKTKRQRQSKRQSSNNSDSNLYTKIILHITHQHIHSLILLL